MSGCSRISTIGNLAAYARMGREIHEAGGTFSVEAKKLPTLDHLLEEFRQDGRFSRVVVGASPGVRGAGDLMGFRFRRSIRILPGLRLNFGKRGVSTSIGVRGAHVTFGKTGTRTTVGLPGSGLSYTHLEKPHQAHQEGHSEAQPPAVPDRMPKGRAWRGWAWILLLVAIAAVFVRAAWK